MEGPELLRCELSAQVKGVVRGLAVSLLWIADGVQIARGRQGDASMTDFQKAGVDAGSGLGRPAGAVWCRYAAGIRGSSWTV